MSSDNTYKNELWGRRSYVDSLSNALKRKGDDRNFLNENLSSHYGLKL